MGRGHLISLIERFYASRISGRNLYARYIVDGDLNLETLVDRGLRFMMCNLLLDHLVDGASGFEPVIVVRWKAEDAAAPLNGE